MLTYCNIVGCNSNTACNCMTTILLTTHIEKKIICTGIFIISETNMMPNSIINCCILGFMPCWTCSIEIYSGFTTSKKTPHPRTLFINYFRSRFIANCFYLCLNRNRISDIQTPIIPATYIIPNPIKLQLPIFIISPMINPIISLTAIIQTRQSPKQRHTENNTIRINIINLFSIDLDSILNISRTAPAGWLDVIALPEKYHSKSVTFDNLVRLTISQSASLLLINTRARLYISGKVIANCSTVV